MAILDATPSTLQAVEAQAQAGDVIRLAAGTYTTRPNRAAVTYQAIDWDPGRVLRGTTGHLGAGMVVRFATAFNLSAPGMVIRGVFHDTRPVSSINAGVFTASNITMEDCASSARPANGTRQIGYTLGTGAIRVSNTRFLRCRHHPTGQPGNVLDHAYYLKNCTGSLLQDCLIYDGGRFPLHLYTDADSNVFERCVVWGSGGCITFSGAADSSTGTSAYGTSDNNRVTGSILGQARLGSLVESWTSDPNRPVSGNQVSGCMFWRGTGAATYPGSVRGVTLTNNVQRDPEFRNPAIGDFTRTGTYDGYGPAQLFGAVTPPPPPPPPPPSDDAALIQSLKGDLDLMLEQANQTRLSLNAFTERLAIARGRITQ